MSQRKIAGPWAGVRKYDLLTALAVAGLAGPPSYATSMTRLIALITARYNWRTDEISIGQAELARLWSVDLRTVKREVKRLRSHGLLVIKREGVRGRVATYGLDHARIEALTSAVWPLVGSDFEERMGTFKGLNEGQSVVQTTVVQFPSTDRSEWSRTRPSLRQADPARYDAWFKPLIRDDRQGSLLRLRAPSSFHAGYVTTHLIGDLTRAVRSIDTSVESIEIRGDGDSW